MSKTPSTPKRKRGRPRVAEPKETIHISAGAAEKAAFERAAAAKGLALASWIRLACHLQIERDVASMTQARKIDVG